MAISNSSGKSCSSTPDAWQRFENGQVAWSSATPEVRGAIVAHYASKIKIIALRMKAKLPQHIELGELLSAGSLGLIEALEKFQVAMGIKFETYAENRIKGAMLDELRRMDWFTRGLRQRVRLLEEHMRKVEQHTGRVPTAEELQVLTGLSAKDVQEGLEALQNQVCISLDGLEDHLLRSSSTTKNDPFSHTLHQQLIDKLAELIDELTPREQMVLSLYYAEELNMRETAMVMNITEGRVSQLHSQALNKLRDKFTKLQNTPFAHHETQRRKT
ncbi:FliA/WhiG family RNA polymerase sigma factor [Desulfonatronum thioautotrophicum]|uniref:FliA/WhiG family RNA polymerase sigma factor n=1 Tax=Desulfonatronum thioautotrophicum TaxID=617001 RepID=UPI0005EBD8F9|nr:FliA/WhiG family RNA polymerase sigma factor [Desulfonatronum thioautotrophicum]